MTKQFLSIPHWVQPGFIPSFLLCVFLVAESGKASPWRAMHLLNYNTDKDLETLSGHLPGLHKLGINTLILEVDYHFEFQSHPELRGNRNPITKKAAGDFSKQCKSLGMRLITQFQCLGHQSWKENTFPLLTRYPELDLTPGAFKGNEGIYCREWDPTNPKVNEIVFALMSEIIDAFQADGMHVGLDEVFLLTSEKAPSTRDKNPAEVFAKAVKDYHQLIVKEKGIEMLMWADRLIDADTIDYGEWEASKNGTAPAVDWIPKDIILCDWHYEPRKSYPSIPMFLEKGFRVLPTGWKNVEATQALIRYAAEQKNPAMLGHLFTRWGGNKEDLLKFEALVEGCSLLDTFTQ